jgi:hypothetical protein
MATTAILENGDKLVLLRFSDSACFTQVFCAPIVIKVGRQLAHSPNFNNSQLETGKNMVYKLLLGSNTLSVRQHEALKTDFVVFFKSYRMSLIS